MALIFLTFVALVVISVAASYWIIETQAQDGLILNLAGRQRMLIQQMTKDALEIEKYNGGLTVHHDNLRQAAQVFEQTLQALINGGPAPYLPGQLVDIPRTANPAVVNTLRQLSQSWRSFQHNLETITIAQPDSSQFTTAIKSIEQSAPTRVQQADVAVRLYENEFTQKVDRLQQVHLFFLSSTLILLAVGLWVTQKSIVAPLKELGLAANRVGRGDLDTPVEVMGPAEISRLFKDFEGMRMPSKHLRMSWRLRFDSEPWN
jgi:nitrate/nitrite-specific signal transduction histidine kinase